MEEEKETKNIWLGKSSYGCEYRVEFKPKNIKGVKLGFVPRLKLFLGADLVIAHHHHKKITGFVK